MIDSLAVFPCVEKAGFLPGVSTEQDHEYGTARKGCREGHDSMRQGEALAQVLEGKQ